MSWSSLRTDLTSRIIEGDLAETIAPSAPHSLCLPREPEVEGLRPDLQTVSFPRPLVAHVDKQDDALSEFAAPPDHVLHALLVAHEWVRDYRVKAVRKQGVDDLEIGRSDVIELEVDDYGQVCVVALLDESP